MLKRLFRSLEEMKFHRSVLVGIVASIVDWCALACMVRYAHLSPQIANFPSLLMGSTIQFFGNRHMVFDAGNGHLGRQASRFILVEISAFWFNGGLFHILVTFTSINYLIARPLASFAVFSCFSYPLWRRVFGKMPCG